MSTSRARLSSGRSSRGHRETGRARIRRARSSHDRSGRSCRRGFGSHGPRHRGNRIPRGLTTPPPHGRSLRSGHDRAAAEVLASACNGCIGAIWLLREGYAAGAAAGAPPQGEGPHRKFQYGPRSWSRRDGSRTPRRSDFRVRETHHAEAADPPLPVLRWESPVHAERGAPRCEELSALRGAGRAPRVARETVRSDADPADEARWPRRDEDRDRRCDGARDEDGREREKGLAEDRAALEAVAPILPDRSATLPALPAFRGLIRLHDDELGIRELVPPGFADQEERELVAPCRELEERDHAGRQPP